MILSYLAVALSLITLIFLFFIFIKLRDKDFSENNQTSQIENKIDSVSKDLNEIENQLQSVTAPINELNRFLGGNVATGRLGEWSLESIVSEIMPEGSYHFQYLINPETQERVDCAIKTADGVIVPIDSKFYAGLYGNYQEASNQTVRNTVLNQIKNAVINDATEISNKYIVRNTTSDYAVMYLASEKLNDLLNQIENLRQQCLSDHRVIIQGPNNLAAFLDSVRMGHHYIRLNETASKVANVVRKIKDQFDQFDSSTDGLLKKLDSSVSEVQRLKTRINVLGRELNRGADNLDKLENEE